MEVHAVEPTAVNLPHARSLIIVKKTSTTNGTTEPTTSFYLSSLPPSKGASVFATLIRGHWGGSEIRNHWVRDALWQEDKTRSKNWNINANLAVLRVALIGLRADLEETTEWPRFFEQCQHSSVKPYQLVCNHRLK